MEPAEFWKPYCGAVSLTFDDGRPSQRAHAIPAMNERDIRGTFYLPPRGDDWRESLAPWREVARAGHEIGNHSLSHVCSANFGFSPGGRALERMTLEEIEADILAAQERLVEIAPSQSDWTFCYPCYQDYVGQGAGRQSYAPVVARHFVAGRGGGEWGFANDPRWIDLAYVWGLDAARMTGYELVGLADALTGKGKWVVFVFHGIGDGRLTVSDTDFRMLVDYLARRRDCVWTAPLAAVARKIADAR